MKQNPNEYCSMGMANLYWKNLNCRVGWVIWFFEKISQDNKDELTDANFQVQFIVYFF